MDFWCERNEHWRALLRPFIWIQWYATNHRSPVNGTEKWLSMLSSSPYSCKCICHFLQQKKSAQISATSVHSLQQATLNKTCFSLMNFHRKLYISLKYARHWPDFCILLLHSLIVPSLFRTAFFLNKKKCMLFCHCPLFWQRPSENKNKTEAKIHLSIMCRVQSYCIIII